MEADCDKSTGEKRGNLLAAPFDLDHLSSLDRDDFDANDCDMYTNGTVNGNFAATAGDGSIDEGMNTQRMEDGEHELLQSARKTISLVLTW